jgi:hypothetical protein
MQHFKQGGPGLPADTPKFQKVTQVAMLKQTESFSCESREGTLHGVPGDYLVEDGHGGFYPVSAEFHAANYAPAEVTMAPVSDQERICEHLLTAMDKLAKAGSHENPASELAALVHAYSSAVYSGNTVAATATAVNKTLHNSTVSGARKNVKDIVVVGDGDTFKLVCKASSEAEGWMKSTKAANTPSGCLVQVTTQQRNPDGSYAVAEALAFAPGIKAIPMFDSAGASTPGLKFADI